MERKDVELKYTWDLSKFYNTINDWYVDFEKAKKFKGKLKKFKGKLNSKTALKEFLNLSKQCDMLLSRLAMFVYNNLNIELSNTKFNEMQNKLSTLATELGTEESFVEPELLSYNENYLKELKSDADFKNYKFWLKNLIKDKKHVLSEKEEELLSGMSSFSGDSGYVFDSLTDVDFKFEDAVDSSGNKHELTQSTFGLILKEKDRALREDAYKKYYGKFKDFNNTIYINYLSNLKSDYFYSKVKKFKDTFSASLYGSSIPEKLYFKLKEEVRNHLNLCKEYYLLRKKTLKYDKLTFYDVSVTISEDFDKNYTFEEAKAIVLEALKPLGEEYLNLIKKAFDERWIDVYPTTDKISGGYENTIYGFTPVILLNFVGTISDVFTLAHELGHAMHSYFANNAQPYETSQYTIFLAEIASTFNEVLLTKYFLKNCGSDKEKLYFLDKYVNLFNGTVFRQMQYSEFEEYAHNLVANNLAISKELLNKKYFELNGIYNEGIENDELKSYHWSIVPHFYRSFYVYKYATGLISAVSLATMVLNGGEKEREKYFEFLKSGGKDYSTTILKNAGVDLTTSEPYEIAFNELKNAIMDMKKIIK